MFMRKIVSVKVTFLGKVIIVFNGNVPSWTGPAATPGIDFLLGKPQLYH